MTRFSLLTFTLLITTFSTLAVSGQDGSLIPGRSSNPRPPTYDPEMTTIGATVNFIDVGRRFINQIAWDRWRGRTLSETNQKADAYLKDKPVGHSVVIEANSSTKIESPELDFNTPPPTNMNYDVVGSGETRDQAIEQALFEKHIKSDTQPYRQTVVTKTETGFLNEPVNQALIAQATQKQLQAEKKRTEAQAAEAKQKFANAQREAEAARIAAKNVADEKGKKDADEKAEKMESERKKAEKDQDSAEQGRKEAQERADLYDKTMKDARECKSNCKEKYEEAEQQIEKAIRISKIARCVQTEPGGTGGSGPCSGPNECPVCRSLADASYQAQLRGANHRFDQVTIAINRINRGFQRRIGRKMKMIQSPIPVGVYITKY